MGAQWCVYIYIHVVPMPTTTTTPTQEASSSSSSTATDASSSGYSSDDSDSSAGEHHHRDGIRCTATADELAIARQLAKDPWGRFGGKEGKMARIRQQEAALMAARTQGSTQGTSSMTPIHTTTLTTKRRKQQSAPQESSKKSKKIVTPLVIVIGQQQNEEDPQHDGAPSTSITDGTWWGARYFSWGGLLGSGTRPKHNTRRGFDEQDQEALYTKTHEGKSTGKQGLGRGGRPGELRGAGWKGTKLTFDEEDAQGEGGDEQGNIVSGRLRGIKWKAQVKRVLRQVRGGVWWCVCVGVPVLSESEYQQQCTHLSNADTQAADADDQARSCSV